MNFLMFVQVIVGAYLIASFIGIRPLRIDIRHRLRIRVKTKKSQEAGPNSSRRASDLEWL